MWYQIYSMISMIICNREEKYLTCTFDKIICKFFILWHICFSINNAKIYKLNILKNKVRLSVTYKRDTKALETGVFVMNKDHTEVNNGEWTSAVF